MGDHIKTGQGPILLGSNELAYIIIGVKENEKQVMNQNTEWQDRLPNPETQTPHARSRWQAE